MRHQYLPAIGLTILLAGCASMKSAVEPTVEASPPPVIFALEETANGDSPQPQSYVGVRGFFARPPLFEDPAFEAAYQRCAPLEITRIQGKGSKIELSLIQNGQKFTVTGLNRKKFAWSSGKRLPILDRYFVRSLDVLRTERDLASLKSRLCAGEVWKNMSVDQFRFLAGDPEARGTVKSPQGKFNVWTFIGKGSAAVRYYYFMQDRLYSWTK